MTIPSNNELEMRVLIGQRKVSNWSFQRRCKKTENTYGYPPQSTFDILLTDLSNKMYAYLSDNNVIIGYLIAGYTTEMFSTIEELRSSRSFRVKAVNNHDMKVIVRRYNRSCYSEDIEYEVPQTWVDEVLQKDKEFLTKRVLLTYNLSDGTEVQDEVTNATLLYLKAEGTKVSVDRYNYYNYLK